MWINSVRVPVTVQFGVLNSSFPQNTEEKSLLRGRKLLVSSDLKRSPGGSSQILNIKSCFASYLWNQYHSFKPINILVQDWLGIASTLFLETVPGTVKPFVNWRPKTESESCNSCKCFQPGTLNSEKIFHSLSQAPLLDVHDSNRCPAWEINISNMSLFIHGGKKKEKKKIITNLFLGTEIKTFFFLNTWRVEECQCYKEVWATVACLYKCRLYYPCSWHHILSCICFLEKY